jgi:hypothetical protein
MLSVYVDDLILAVVENEDRSLIRRVSRATLHAIHSLFQPQKRSGHVGGKDPVSQKKLEKGDATFEIEKEILGFLINGAKCTVRPSSTKAQAIADKISKVLRKPHVPLKRFRSLLGKLQHASRIFPAAKGLFSPLNKATAKVNPRKSPSKCALSNEVTRPYGRTTPHQQAGPPKWRTKQAPRSRVSSSGRWPCGNVRAARLSPPYPTMLGHKTSWLIRPPALSGASIMAAPGGSPHNRTMSF